MERRKSDSGELSGETLKSSPVDYACSLLAPMWENPPSDRDWPPSRPGNRLMYKHTFQTAVNGRDPNVNWDEESMLARLLALYDDPSRNPEQDPADDTAEEDRVVHLVSYDEDVTSDSGTVEIHMVPSHLMTPSEDQGKVDRWQDETPVYLARTNKSQPRRTTSRVPEGTRSSTKPPAELSCLPRPRASQTREEAVKARTFPRYAVSPALPSQANTGPTPSKHVKGRKTTRPKTPWKSSSLEDFRPNYKTATISKERRRDAPQGDSSVSPKKITTIPLRHPREPVPHNNSLAGRSPNIIGVGALCKPSISKHDTPHTRPSCIPQRDPSRVWNGSWYMPADEHTDFLAWANNRKASIKFNNYDPPTPDTSAAFLERMGKLEASCKSNKSSCFDENSPLPRASLSNSGEPRYTENNLDSHVHQSKYSSPQQRDMGNECPYFNEDFLKSRTTLSSSGEPRYEENIRGSDTRESNFSSSIQHEMGNESPSFEEYPSEPREPLSEARMLRHKESIDVCRTRQSYYSNALQNDNTIESSPHEEGSTDLSARSFSGWGSSNKDTITPSRVRKFQYSNSQQDDHSMKNEPILHSEQLPPTKDIVADPSSRSRISSPRAIPIDLADRLFSGLISPKISPRLWIDSRFPSSKYFSDTAIGSRLVSVAELPGSEINKPDQSCPVQFPVFEAVEGLSPENTGIIPRLNIEIFRILGVEGFRLRMAIDVVVGITPRILIVDRRDMDLQFSIVDGYLATSKGAEWRIDSDGDYALLRSEKMSEGEVVKVEIYWTGKMKGSCLELPVVVHHVVLGGEICCETNDTTMVLQMDDGEELTHHFSEHNRRTFLPTLKPKHGMSVSFGKSPYVDTATQQDHLQSPVTELDNIDPPLMLQEAEYHTYITEDTYPAKASTPTTSLPSLRTLLNATIIGILLGFSFNVFQNPGVALDFYSKALTTASTEYPLSSQLSAEIIMRRDGGEEAEMEVIVVVDEVEGLDDVGVKKKEKEEMGVRNWIDRMLGWRGF